MTWSLPFCGVPHHGRAHGPPTSAALYWTTCLLGLWCPKTSAALPSPKDTPSPDSPFPPSLPPIPNKAQATEDYISKIKTSFIPCCPIVLSCGCIQLSEHVSTSSWTLSESRVAEKYKYLGCTVNEHLGVYENDRGTSNGSQSPE